MLKHKACHQFGLDTYVVRQFNKKLANTYFLYVFDYAMSETNVMSDFFSIENNKANTWNYNLEYESTSKPSVMRDSVKFGFGDYRYNASDNHILVKAIGHQYSSTPLGQSHIVAKNQYETTYDKSKYIGQKILNTHPKYNNELNIFCVRDLNTRKLHMFCILCVNNISVNINRKQSKCAYKPVDISILGNKLINFVQYMNSINLDYGRVELLFDHKLGWCVIDINNSPGYGTIGEMARNNLVRIFEHICH